MSCREETQCNLWTHSCNYAYAWISCTYRGNTNWENLYTGLPNFSQTQIITMVNTLFKTHHVHLYSNPFENWGIRERKQKLVKVCISMTSQLLNGVKCNVTKKNTKVQDVPIIWTYCPFKHVIFEISAILLLNPV